MSVGPDKVGGKESELLDRDGAQPGDEATVWRAGHPHGPDQHTDAVLVRKEGDGSWSVVEKVHVPKDD